MARRKTRDIAAANGDAAGPARPGIIAVAKQANVSIATVSRVLNKRGTVQPELAKRVREAIQQTGYLPNVSARSLSSGRSRIFGVIISNLMNPFFPELLQSFEEHAVAAGYEVLVASTAYDLQRMGSCIDRMLERKVDGVAVMTFGIEGPLLSRFVDHGIPLVFMDKAPEGPHNFAIEVDYASGIQQAIQHLAVLGHRRIGFISGPEQQVSVANRMRAIERAARDIGLTYDPELLYAGDHTLESGEQGLARFLALKSPPTAILCSNDLSAIGVMHGAEERGLSIPHDLSLIGFDGIEIGGYMVPALTSVVMSRRAIAEQAVELLWSSVEGRQGRPSTVSTHLLVRRTTAVPRGALADLSPASQPAAGGRRKQSG